MKRLIAALVIVSALSAASRARAAVISVTGWDVHNGTSTVGGSAGNPTFSPGDNLTLMAPFEAITLADGEFIEGATQLTMNSRTANTGVNALNTQLRVGLFNGPAGAVVASDVPNLGFIIEYTNAAAGGLIREQTSAVQTNPFTSPTNLGNGTQDSGADSIQGANPGPVTFTLRLTRSGSALNLLGSISGTDSVSGNPYLANYTLNAIAATNFTFNRIGLFLGGNADATSAALANTTVTTIPEPTAFALLAGLAGVAGLRGPRRLRH